MLSKVMASCCGFISSYQHVSSQRGVQDLNSEATSSELSSLAHSQKPFESPNDFWIIETPHSIGANNSDIFFVCKHDKKKLTQEILRQSTLANSARKFNGRCKLSFLYA